MREDVKKFLFIGPEEDKLSFFRNAQSKGIIHFIDPDPGSSREVPEEVTRLIGAIKVLRGQPVVEQEESFESLHSISIVDTILDLHEQHERLQEELRTLSVEIGRIEVFGNFSLEEIAYIEKEGKCRIRFFAGRPALFQEEPEPGGLIFISSEHGLDYYLSITEELFVYEKMVELTFDRTLSTLKNREDEVRALYRDVEHRLKIYAKYNDFLHDALIDTLNRYHSFHTQTYVQEVMGNSLFAGEGWVPVNKIDALEQVMENTGVIAEEVAIEEGDVAPTYLENKGQARLGEDLVHIYDTPSNTDNDPSMWVLYGFALFFAFIIGDAGYGFVYLVLALIVRRKYPNLQGLSRRVLNLFTFLSVGCVIWGTLMTSFFGMQIAPDHPIRHLSLLQWLAEKKGAYHLRAQDPVFQDWTIKYPELKNITDVHQFVSFTPDPEKARHVILDHLTGNIMFELALFVGVVHLILSLLRYLKRHPQNIGWAIFLFGAYLYFPYYLKTPSILNFVFGVDLVKGGEFGLQLICVGIGIAWVVSIIRNGWVGIFEIATLIQVFADTLSYLRLYALGLAGAIVASTVNEIAAGLPIFIGILLVLISHFINIILGTMSAIIHGLRLNFLEWYHYSFEGGGKQFEPLKLLKKKH